MVNIMNNEKITKEEYDSNIEDILEYADSLHKPKKIHKMCKEYSTDDLTVFMKKITSFLPIMAVGADCDFDIGYGYFSVLDLEGRFLDDIFALITSMYEYVYRKNKRAWLRFNDSDDEFIIVLKEKDFLEIYEIIKDNLMDEDGFTEDEFPNNNFKSLDDIIENEDILEEIRDTLDNLDEE